ncbi:transmembrane protein, putative [Bodo saltans]|uniref:Transmembrane protein, putative n=1 Tax=Bodo saltans TaxID=75058 RepID=A0A0S4JTR0_BODSA|nr:transmembrane protein, putative [Bodo saltans]|eukprot:CUG93968.1 transmembrane protein, putative [Bodo saltans]
MSEGAFVPTRRRNRAEGMFDKSESPPPTTAPPPQNGDNNINHNNNSSSPTGNNHRNSNSHNGGPPPQVSLERGLGRLMSVTNIQRRRGSDETKRRPSGDKGNSTTSSASGGATAASGGKGEKKQLLKYGFSLKAREYIAVGFYDQAIALCQKASDVVGWSVSLILSGDPEKAVDIIEAFIIAACLVTYQETNKGIGGVKYDYRQILASIIATPGSQATVNIMQSLPPPTEQLFHETILEVCESANWDELHQWYLTAILLHPSFSPPMNPWLRHFFGLFVHRSAAAKKEAEKLGGKGGGGRRPSQEHHTATAPPGRILPPSKNVVLTRETVENILIAQCGETEILQVNAIVSWRLSRYRTAIRSCSELLKLDPQDIHIRFIRCCCALQLGERHTVGEDSKCLMQSASMLVSTVGCALATFGIPLASARPAVEQFQSTEIEQNYVYSLCEWTHSLTLLQLGEFQAAKQIVEHTLPYVPKRTNLSDNLSEIYTTCCIALEDSSSLLKLPRDLLGRFPQLHIALVPRFGGGFSSDSINKIAIASDVGELLNPLNINCYSDARQMIAIHCTTARSLFSFGHLREAWVEVCIAVGCAEELIGSAVLALSDCAPHRVYFLGCTIGMTLLDRLIEEDEVASKTLTAVELRQKREVDDALGDSIIATSRVWARMVRDFHPNQVLGHAAITQVSIASHDLDSLERATIIADRFPNEVMTQNAVSYALYSKHLIPDAVANAQKTLQKFPHVTEVQTMMYAVSGKEGTYTYLYRGVLPFAYGPGNEKTSSWRLWVAFFVTSLNFVILIGMFLFNLDDKIPFPTALNDTIVRTQVPHMETFYVAAFLFVYSMVTTFYQPTLVSVLLADLHVRNSRLNRFLYSSRCIPWVNVANALQISLLGNNFQFTSAWYTALLYAILAMLQFPYSSRTFFLRSMDEPQMELPFWITLVAADFITFLVFAPLLLVASAIEPIMSIAFHFMVPPLPPSYDTGDIPSRLQIHERAKNEGAMDRFALNSGSTFPHIILMKFIFQSTHSGMSSFYTAVRQQEADDLRVFPLIDVLDDITHEPVSKPTKSLAKPMDVTTQRLIANQREKTDAIEQSVQSAAKAGEGNLQGIMDDLNDDLEEIRLSPDGDGRRDSFGAEIMQALNAEFAKLSDQNTQLQQAVGATQAAKGTSASNGTRLGDVGLYRENKQNTQMLTTGPMMRGKDAAKRRFSINPELSGATPQPQEPRSVMAAAASRQLMDTLRPVSPRAILPAVGQGALLKAGMNRKQSLFRKPEVEFTIEDDDDDASTTRSVSRTTSLFGNRRASFGAAIEGDSDLSSSSSSDSDSPQPAKAPAQTKTAVPPAALAAAKQSFVTGSNRVGSPNPLNIDAPFVTSRQSSGAELKHIPGVKVVGSLTEFGGSEGDDSSRTSSSRMLKVGRSESVSPVDMRAPSSFLVEAASPTTTKRVRSAVTFGEVSNVSPPPAAAAAPPSQQQQQYQQARVSTTFEPSHVSPARSTVSPARSSSVSSPAPYALPIDHVASPLRTTSPVRSVSPHSAPVISPRGSNIHYARQGSIQNTASPNTSIHPAVQSAYAAQLRRKQSAMVQQHNSLMGAISAVSAIRKGDLTGTMGGTGVRSPTSNNLNGYTNNGVRSPTGNTNNNNNNSSFYYPNGARSPTGKTGGNAGPTNGYMSCGDEGDSTLGRRGSSYHREGSQHTAATVPQATTLQRRQSSVGKDFLMDVQARPASNPPTSSSAEAKRVTSAPLSRQELAALEAEDEQPAINGTHKIKKVLDDLRTVRSAAQDALSSGRALTDHSVEVVIRQQVTNAKAKFVADLTKIGARITVDNFELKKQITQLFIELVQEGDMNRPGNLDVVTALLNTVSNVDFAQIITTSRLVDLAMDRGQAKWYVRLLMYKPILTQLTPEYTKMLLESCCRNQERRCALFMALLEVALRSSRKV